MSLLSSASAAPPPAAEPTTHVGQLALEPTALVLERGDALRQVGRRHLEDLAGGHQEARLGASMVERGRAGQRLDAAHPGRQRAFADDAKGANLAGTRDVGAAAQLDREGRALPLSHREHADLLAVLLAKQRQRPGLDRGLGRHQAGLHRPVGLDLARDGVLDGCDVVVAERRRLGDVEAQPVGRHQRALLGHVIAKASMERRVQEMSRRVIGPHRRAPLPIDAHFDDIAHAHRAARHAPAVDVQTAGFFLTIGDRDLDTLGVEHDAAVANLARRIRHRTGFG